MEQEIAGAEKELGGPLCSGCNEWTDKYRGICINCHKRYCLVTCLERCEGCYL